MSDVAIRVESLSKQYKLGRAKYRHDTLRDHLTEGIKGLLRRNGGSSMKHDMIWAVRDVSLEVKHGEILGIIGRNGAGKSTLLKILSRVIEPTNGRAEVYGRVGSLLEIGTGFHPELSGRENVLLSGAILGMGKNEIERKFDEIVAFAELEKFIDTPVKRYSSGMYVRLAFAVAAHLDFDILLIDEVLAVGDAAFQEKCIGTMEKSASNGKTVMLVSHNMASIQHLCSRAILLHAGRIIADGAPKEVIRSYLTDARDASSMSVCDWHDRSTNGQARIVRFDIGDIDGRATTSIPFGGAVRFSIAVEFYEPHVDPCFGVLVHNVAGEPILDLRSAHSGFRIGHVKNQVVVDAVVDQLGLYPGEYLLSPWITVSETHLECLDWVKHCCKLRIFPAPGLYGDLRLDSKWGRYWVSSNWAVQRPDQMGPGIRDKHMNQSAKGQWE